MPQPATTLPSDTDSTSRIRAATVQPATWSETDRSFEVVFTTGAAVQRFDFWDWEFYEETLTVDQGSVRLDRLQAGGPVLRDHVASTRELVGSIVPGSVRIEGGNGICRIRLADTPDAADIVAKVRDGHLRTVSVGYLVHQYTRIERDGQRPILRADDWEPIEVSLTPVPADPGAQVRSEGNTTMPQPRILDENGDEIETCNGGGAVYRGNGPSRARTVTTDHILRACSRANLSREAERQLLEEHERSPMNETQLFDAMLDVVSAQRNTTPINANRHPGTARGTRELFADAIYARLSGTTPSEAAREFMGASLVDMARHLLEANGEPVRFARASAVIDAITRGGQHTTSDFAMLLQSSATRFLIDAFRAASSPLKTLARPRTLPDFREAYGVRVEGDADFPKVNENGEFKRGTLQTSSDKINLETFGEILAISRQALINDDLGAFASVATFFARAAAETEAQYLAGLINGTGATLSDGQPLYHSTHGNVAASGTAIDEVALAAGLRQMRLQKNLDGVTFANVVPKFLVVGPAKEVEAQKAIASITPATTSSVNPFDALQLIVDPRLGTGNSWRLFADPMVHPVLEWATLDGQEGIFTDTRIGFEVDGVEIKARIDIGAAAWDFRGSYMNPGA